MRHRQGAFFIWAGVAHCLLMIFASLYALGMLPSFSIGIHKWHVLYLRFSLFLCVGCAWLIIRQSFKTDFFLPQAILDGLVGVGVFEALFWVLRWILVRGNCTPWISLLPGFFLIYYGIRLREGRALWGRLELDGLSAESADAVEIGGLVRSDELFARAAKVYQERWRTALSIMLLSSAGALASILAAVALCAGAWFFAPRMAGMVVVMALVSLLSFTAGTAFWCHTALLLAAARPGPAPGLAECFEAAWCRLPGFFLTCCLYLAVCFGGFFLFIVPGFIAGLWLVFGPLIYLTEDVGPMEALLKSCYYMRGRSLPVVGLLCLVSAASILPGFIPVAGVALQMLALPFMWMNMAELLADLRRLRQDEPFVPLPRLRLLLFCLMSGCLVPLLLAPWVLPRLTAYLAAHSDQLLALLMQSR